MKICSNVVLMNEILRYMITLLLFRLMKENNDNIFTYMILLSVKNGMKIRPLKSPTSR